MTTFEEQFPSLKGKCFMSAIGNSINDDDNLIETSMEIFNKYLLDKQRVREAIEKIKYKNINAENYIILVDELLKELGL